MSLTTNKIHELQSLVAGDRYEVVAITETWLTSAVNDHEILPRHFSVHRKDREETAPGVRGGGVLLAVDSDIPSRRRADLEADDGEILVCELGNSSQQRLALVLCYRPPVSDSASFIDSLETTLNQVSLHYSSFFVLGDFNYPHINWNDNDRIDDFSLMMNTFFLSQVNDVPSNAHNNVLDLMFTNTPNTITDVTDVHADFPTDHTVLSCTLALSRPTARAPAREVLCWKDVNLDTLSTVLHEAPLTDFSSCSSVDGMWQHWSDTVQAIVKSQVPTRRMKPTRDPPWFDGAARHAINRKMSALKRAKLLDTDAAWARFKLLRNEAKTLTRTKQEEFVGSLDELCREKPKRFWAYFKSKTNSTSMPNELSSGDVTSSIPAQKAVLMNNYFGSVFQNSTVVDPFHPSKGHGPIPRPAQTPSFSPEDVISVLKTIDVSSAQPPGDIPAHVLKHCRIAIAPSLSILFNVSLACSTVPEPWKSANVVPIFKKGDKHNACNYRPISLLPTVSKIMERCVFNALYAHVSPSLHPLQHGFIKGRSCTTQLLHIYHTIGSTLDNGGQTDIVFLDFSKAFDCVPHDLLLHKLKLNYGIENPLLSWLSSYLSLRNQRVLIEGEKSPFIPVTSGVPQGSILGPLLFLLYINDMPFVASCPTALFADDSKCFKQITCIEDCQTLQNDLNNFYNWSQIWKMSFNASKCKVLSITRSQNPICFNYSMNNAPLDNVNVFTDLGVTLDGKLSFNNHIQHIVSKATRVCGMIKRSVGFRAPANVKLTLFKMYSRSILETSCQVWSPQCKNVILKIESVQRRMSKFVLNDYVSSYSARCTALNILPLSYRREITDLTLAYKALNNLLNVDFTDTLRFQPTPNHNVRTFDSHKLFTRRSNTETFLASYFNRTPQLWNLLPLHIRSSHSLHVFKERLYKHYLNKSHSHYDVDNSCTLTSLCRCTGFYH